MKYLENPEFLQEGKDFLGHRITKTKIKSLATEIVSRLYKNNKTQVSNLAASQNDIEIMEVMDDAPPKEQSLTEKLNKLLESPNAEIPEMDKNDIAIVLKSEMNLFEQTKKKPKDGYLQLLESALLTIPPTSVESERAFSIFGYFCNKIRSQLKPTTIDALLFLRHYYKNNVN